MLEKVLATAAVPAASSAVKFALAGQWRKCLVSGALSVLFVITARALEADRGASTI